MRINADQLVEAALLKIKATEREIEALQEKAKSLGECEALSITRQFLDNDLNFPEQVISLSSSGALASLVLLLKNRLLRSDELTPVLLGFLGRQCVCEDDIIQSRVKESFNTWSDEVKIKFSFTATSRAHFYSLYPFINDYLRQYSMAQDQLAWSQKLPFGLSSYNPETQTSLMSVYLEFVSTQEQAEKAAAQFCRVMALGYNEKRIIVPEVGYFIEIDDEAVRLVENCSFRPETFSFSGSFEEQLTLAILKAVQMVLNA